MDDEEEQVYFLGLRPLAGYASLKLYHVMSFFCMRNVSCAMIWLVRLCMLPTRTPDDAGDASFLGPSRDPNQKADMGSRARAPEAAETAAQEEQPASQPGNANATKRRKYARAHAPEGPKTIAKKARTAQHASQPQQKQTDRTTAHRSAQQFLTVFTAFCRGGPSIAGQNARK